MTWPDFMLVFLYDNKTHENKAVYGRQSAIRLQISENLPPANSLTVLQIYRQAFLIPQLTLIFVNL